MWLISHCLLQPWAITWMKLKLFIIFLFSFNPVIHSLWKHFDVTKHRKRALSYVGLWSERIGGEPEVDWGWSPGRVQHWTFTAHGSKGIEYPSKSKADFSLTLQEKGIVKGELLRHLTGCLRGADNHLCGRTTSCKKGEIAIEAGWIKTWVQLEKHLGGCQPGVWRWWAWFCSLQMES